MKPKIVRCLVCLLFIASGAQSQFHLNALRLNGVNAFTKAVYAKRSFSPPLESSIPMMMHKRFENAHASSKKFKKAFGDFVYRDKHITYGPIAGKSRCYISNLEPMILSEPYFLNFTMQSQPEDGWTAGAFLIYRRTTPLAIQTDITYSEHGAKLLFNNTEKDFNYTMKFKYQFVNIDASIKLYPFSTKDEENMWRGPNISVGAQVGFNIAPQNITYTSGGSGRLAAFGSDLDQQQQLRNVLQGKNDFSLICGIAYELRRFGLTLSARYQLGLSDVIETQANSYNFIEIKNTKRVFGFTIGWDFSFFDD